MRLDQKEIKKLLNIENPIILEIGANIGIDTKKFLNEFKNINIYCFEPDPRCIKKFKQSINDKRCVLIDAAVSSIDGETDLNMSGGLPSEDIPRRYKLLGLGKFYSLIMAYNQSSSIKKSISNPKDYPWLIFYKTVRVKTIKLDTWVKEKNIRFIDFIWSDVQGAERDMIEGSVGALKITKYIYMEYGEKSSYPDAMTRSETIELLGRYNFKVIPEYSYNSEIGNLLFGNKYLI